MKALLIPADGPPRQANLPGDGGARFMRSLRNLIGTDCAERIQVTTCWEAWLDENGSAAGKPVNEAATGLSPAQAAARQLPSHVALYAAGFALICLIVLARSPLVAEEHDLAEVTWGGADESRRAVVAIRPPASG
jgi:hypothetical protein